MTMAFSSFHVLLLFFSLSLLSVSCFSASHEPKPNLQSPSPFILPIKKDPQTSLFYTSLAIGTPSHKIDLAIDVGGPSLWYDCNSHYNSSSYSPIPCSSKQCPSSSPCTGCDGPFKPGCSNNTCGLDILNPLADYIFSGDLGQDLISISRTQLSGFLSGCTASDAYSGDAVLLQGLPKQSKGIIGLARTDLSFPRQLTLAKNLPQKFALCLPSSSDTNGNIFIGVNEVPQSLPQFLFSTPLIINPFSTAPAYTEGDASYEYFIDVKSISVDGHVLNIKPSLLSIDETGNGGTKLSTMTPYTKLHSSILKPLVREFVKKASDRKMKRVSSVAPFEACFDATSIKKTSSGLDVPIIDLELQGTVFWSIYGGNSMAEVKKNVVCLAFVDGGKVPTKGAVVTSIVIGGHALQDNYVEFDLASSKLRFSNWLLLQNARCSQSSTVSSF